MSKIKKDSSMIKSIEKEKEELKKYRKEYYKRLKEKQNKL